MCGVSLYSVPMGVWNWGQGEITYASNAYAQAFAAASDRIHQECTKAGGHGVVGVHVEADGPPPPRRRRPGGDGRPPGRLEGAVGRPGLRLGPLRPRLRPPAHAAGWAPLGLAVGASFVYAPRRSAGVAIKQKSQNVELTNFTEAMYSARESAMERMQQSALAMGGTGVVEVKVDRGPDGLRPPRRGLHRLRHGGAAGGRATPGSWRRVMVLPLDDPVRDFDVTSLRG